MGEPRVICVETEAMASTQDLIDAAVEAFLWEELLSCLPPVRAQETAAGH
jgi:hypothetical protein